MSRQGTTWLTLYVFVSSFLFLGTVFKKKDAVQMTQTDPIGYQQKVEEEKDGPKGPPSPSLKLFPRARFLAEGPVEKSKHENVVAPGNPEEEFEFWSAEGEEKTGPDQNKAPEETIFKEEKPAEEEKGDEKEVQDKDIQWWEEGGWEEKEKGEEGADQEWTEEEGTGPDEEPANPGIKPVSK